MKKRAILIGAPGGGYNGQYLSGVDKDIHNTIRFMQSPSGGGWFRKEIIAIQNPTKDQILSELRQSPSDYTVVVFSGHGKYTYDGTVIAINNNETMSLTELSAWSRKQMIILDTCRTFDDDNSIGWLNANGGDNLKEFPSYLTVREARRIFDTHLRRCEDGVVLCFSCLRGQESDDTAEGGAFTTSLLDMAQTWTQTISRHSILPIKGAFVYTKFYMDTYLTSDQTPTLRTLRPRQYWFPFAIKPASRPVWH